MSATEKLAISLPKDLIEKLRRAKDEGRIESVSGHIADLLRREDDWRDARATLDRIFERCPGPGSQALRLGPAGSRRGRRARQVIGGRILDTSALLQAARGTPYMQALLYISHEHLITLVIPAPCLADALARLKDAEQQARLFDLLKSPMAKVAQFGTAEATGTGLLRADALPARASTGAAHARVPSPPTVATARGERPAGPDPCHASRGGDRNRCPDPGWLRGAASMWPGTRVRVPGHNQA